MQLYQQAWKAIISPPQIKSKPKNYGPKERIINNCKIIRNDFKILNRNNKHLVGFVFYSPDFQATETILYIHGNGGTKIDALPLVDLIPKYKVSVAAVDLLGCGSSDPAYLTYGVNEAYDIHEIVQEIKHYGSSKKITLWGRSMGAQCCIMYAQMFQAQINGMILDSPFRNLSNVIQRIAKKQDSLPQILIKPILYFIKKKAVSQVKVDIFTIDYLENFKKIQPTIPILFIYSHFDKIVPTQEVFQFYNIYQGPKDLCQIFQTHDQDRPDKIFVQGMIWITRAKKNISLLKNKNKNTVLRSKEQINLFC